jgi:hypothetical protein
VTLVEVTSRENSSGLVMPVCFTWQGKEYPVQDIGQRWSNGEGEPILEMVPDDRLIELVYHPDKS